jgi:hypothetical protein
VSYFVPLRPGSNEHSTYNRAPIPFFWYTNDITWVWRFDTDTSFATWPRARMCVLDDAGNRVPVTDWVEADAKKEYPFSFNLPNKHYCASPEIEGMLLVIVLAKPFVVNSSGVPLPEQKPWASMLRFEVKYGPHLNHAEQLDYTAGTPQPKYWPIKSRVVQPYTERLTKNNLWVHIVGPNYGPRLTRIPVELPTGDIAIEENQKYFYNDATTFGQDNPVAGPPVATLRDGPRGVGTIGYLYKIIVRRGLKGFYQFDTAGRLSFQMPDGREMTIAGWRNKPGELPAHSGVTDPNYMYGSAALPGMTGKTAEHLAHYRSKYEMYGDWSRVRGAQAPLEPWGGCVMMRLPDGSIDLRNGLDLWWADTLHHRFLYVDGWTGHPEFYMKAHFPPIGYVPPEEPTGQATVVTFLDTPDGQPDESLNEPWDMTPSPDGQWLWYTNCGNGSIWKVRPDGTDKQLVLKNPTPQPGWDQLPTPQRKRLDVMSAANIALCREQYLRDGPVGEASCFYPQRLMFNSEGKLIWGELYTYALRELDPVTMMVRTLALIPKVGFGSTSAASHDVAFDIDIEGTCGPKDDIFTQSWHDGDHRFSKDGTYQGRWCWTSGADMEMGPLNKVGAPSYAWGVACGDGVLRATGNGGGYSDILITKRQPEDLEPDDALWWIGRITYQMSRLAVTHGPAWQGRTGLYPTIEEAGSWDSATLQAYFAANGIDESTLDYVQFNYSGDATKLANYRAKIQAQGKTLADALEYFVRFNTQHIDYSVVEHEHDWGAWEPTSDWSECENGQQSRTEQRTDSAGHVETRIVTQACTMPLTCDEQLAEALLRIEQLETEVSALTGKIATAVTALGA